MQLRVLGPVEASADGRSLPLGGAKQRSVLAMLGLEANRTVSADHLIEGLWGEHAPASAAKMVQNYVWRLRTVLGEAAGAEILTRGGGYELRIDPDSVDVLRFQRLLAEAARSGGSGAPADAAHEALALWRGPALSDVADEPFAAPAIRRLEELRLEAAELAIDADLAAGHHLEVAAELDALVAEHPLRERLHGQRMLALYRCGRQAEALEAYRAARRTLVEEIGVEPGPELRRLHEAILRQDDSLEVDAAVAELPRELDTVSSSPLVGRDGELAWLRGHWERARRSDGGLVTLVGTDGMGKTRLAAEAAGEVHGEGATVLYVAGMAAPDAALAAIRRAREARRPTLLVVDDADCAVVEVHGAMSRLAAELRDHPSLVVATGRNAAALAGLRPSASLALAALDAAAVRWIAVLYAPAGAAADVPVDTLLETSDGVASRVHALASEWAQREAARRVEAVADRAAAGRVQARALESELTGSVVALQSTHQRVELLAAPDGGTPVICPFKGLAAFEVDDAEYFFGREQLVAELVARLVGAPLLAIVGPSGSGKSSALRAGLLPALARGVLPGSERWTQVLIRPGERPMRELRRATSGLGEDRRILVAVDQFEETFTACRDERERDAFVAAVVRAAQDHDGRSAVVLAVRADFYARCAAYPELARLVGASHVLVGPMSRDELRRAITRPAEQVGLRVEPDLEDAVVADVEGQPGALPLLSTALLELWQQRRGRRLYVGAYSRTGGVHGAVARLAEDAFGQLEPAEQEVARTVLLRLAGEDEDGGIVRRRVPLAELEAQRSESIALVLDVLTARRLLTVSAGTVEVAHEALLREWPRLCGWLEEDAEGRRVHRHLADAARDWAHGDRDRGELYLGARLASALEWRAEHEPELNTAEHQFLDASRAASERARRRGHLVLGGVVALLVIATIAALLALDGRGRARAQARAADAQRLGAQALNEQTLDRSLLLARQGVALDDTPATRENLLAAVRRSPAAISVMRGDGDGLTAVALHPDGRTLAVGDYNGTVVFLDARTRRRLGRPHQSGAVSGISSLAFSPDGTRLASAGRNALGGFVDLFDGQTRRHIARLSANDPLWESVATVSFSPDSRVLAAQTGYEIGPDRFNRLLRWDARTGRLLGDVRPIPGRSWRLLGLVGPQPRLVTSSVEGRATVIRDAATMRPVREFPVAGRVAALSPTEGLIGFGSRDGSVRLLDIRTGNLETATSRHEGPVTAMRFSSDGRRLVTAGRDERLIVWDTSRAAAVETLQARGRGLVVDLAIVRDGGIAYSAGRDGTVVAWDLDGARRLERPFSAAGRALAPRSLTVAAHGSQVATTDAHGFVDLFDSRTRRLTGRVRVDGGQPAAAAIAPDGRTLAAITARGELGVWDVRTGRPLGPLQPAHADAGEVTLTFSAGGRWLASGGGGDIVRLWDARRRTTVETLARAVADLSLNKDGTMLAVTLRGENFNGGLEILSVPSLKIIRTVPAPTGTLARFSRDGRWLIYGDRVGRVWTFDTRTWKSRGRPLLAHGPLLAADLSPDGRLLVTTSVDGTARLWDVGSGRPIGGPLSAGYGDMVGAAFVREGRGLAVVHEHGGYLWDVRPSSWERHACAVAGRSLTRAEWENALPHRDYSPACRRP
jgi:WD40 repeat protein/DNA-binding SARP family transcriptional activator